MRLLFARNYLTKVVQTLARSLWKLFLDFNFSLLIFLIALQPAVINAQTIPDSTVPSTTPSLDVTANGIPLVNIATPSAAGVSHNKFQSLNIDAQGMVFNNSKNFGTSKIGGVVLANPNLKNSNTARIILNEVTGSTSSA